MWDIYEGLAMHAGHCELPATDQMHWMMAMAMMILHWGKTVFFTYETLGA